MKSIPEKGLKAGDILKKLEEYAKNDFDPHSKRMWGHIYYAGQEDIVDLVRKA